MIIDPEILIARNLAGEASKEEQMALDQWIQEKPENKRIYEEFLKCWELSGSWKSVKNSDVEENLAELWKKSHAGNGPRTFRIAQFYKLAAAVVIGIAFLGGYLWLRSKPLEKPQESVRFASESQVKAIVLPDGSKVWMNRHSILKPVQISEIPTREYELTGEAFFDVKHDSVRPFIIHAGNSLVRVLGTSFNVKNNTLSGETEVLVETGKVRFQLEGANSPAIILTPGELGIAAKESGQLTKTAYAAGNYLAWKTRCLIFRETSLDSVVQSIAEVYNVSIQLSDPSLARLRFTSRFEDSSLPEILDVLRLAFPQVDVVKDDSDRYSIKKK